MKNYYTEKEIQYLKENINILSLESMAKALNRKESSIQQKLYKLKIFPLEKEKFQIGEKYNRLTLIGKDINKSKPQRPYYLYQCDCGNVTSQRTDAVRNGFVKSCGCYNAEKLFQDEGIASFNTYFIAYKSGAKLRGKIFELNKTEFFEIIKQNCHYCGAPPKLYNKYYKKDGTLIKSKNIKIISEESANRAWIKVNGIDRVNNEIGYKLENCVPCCTICNHAKHDLSYEDFLSYLQKLSEFRIKMSIF